MSFFDLYYDLAVQLNDTADDALANTKVWINWTLRDLCNMYDFPQLYKTITITGSSYDFKRLQPLTSASAVSLFSDNSADTGITATVYGYQLSLGDRTYITENIALNGTATASGSSSFSHIERIELGGTTTGNISISAQSGKLKGTMLPAETVIANDYKRIVKVDASGDVMPMEYADRKLKWTNDSSIDEKVYTVAGTTINLYGVSGSKTIVYLTRHPWLINDLDTSPIIDMGIEDSDLVEAARLGWGLRFEDEADGVMGKQMYKQKLSEIIGEIVFGGDDIQEVAYARRR